MYYAYIYVCMYVCMYVSYIYMYVSYIYICIIYICIIYIVYMCICMYIYIHIVYVYIYNIDGKYIWLKPWGAYHLDATKGIPQKKQQQMGWSRNGRQLKGKRLIKNGHIMHIIHIIMYIYIHMLRTNPNMSTANTPSSHFLIYYNSLQPLLFTR